MFISYPLRETDRLTDRQRDKEESMAVTRGAYDKK